MNTAELIKIINENEVAIYGAGYAAKNFYTALKIRNMDKQVRCFIVTEPEKAQGLIEGIPVRSVKDIVEEKNIYICIAVHEAIRDEIEFILGKFSINKYIWVHPFIMELALGDPLEYHKHIEVKKIVQCQPYDNYAFAVRYLAIENYYNKNDKGYDIYLKAMNLQCEVETAKKRLESFVNLIKDWDEHGYQPKQDILIDESSRLIDGTHRLSLAVYHRMELIDCTIFPVSDYYSKMVKENHFLTMDTLKRNQFSSYEVGELEKAQAIIRQTMGITEG